MELITMSEIARLLGVSRQQVWAWHDRRKRNGFPEHHDLVHRTMGEPVRVWRRSVVEQWFDSYVPSLGGRPPAPRVERDCSREELVATRL